MKQRTLSIQRGRSKIVSKPFDFEAMCIVDDAHKKGTGAIRAGMEAVYYLFTGTSVTDEDIHALSYEKQTELAMRVFKWYGEAAENALKNL